MRHLFVAALGIGGFILLCAAATILLSSEGEVGQNILLGGGLGALGLGAIRLSVKLLS